MDLEEIIKPGSDRLALAYKMWVAAKFSRRRIEALIGYRRYESLALRFGGAVARR